jgi:coproporphyrinogen III oxidase
MFEAEKSQAAGWFHMLRDRIVAAFEELEADATPAGEMAMRFEVTPTTRPMAAAA